jgi:hypothetical protein
MVLAPMSFAADNPAPQTAPLPAGNSAGVQEAQGLGNTDLPIEFYIGAALVFAFGVWAILTDDEDVEDFVPPVIPPPTTTPPSTTPPTTTPPTTTTTTTTTGRCDIRLKRDIEPAGVANGVRLYSFRYWNDERTYIGPMAQELLADERFRDAVMEDGTGYYLVNLTALGLDSLAEQDDFQQAGQDAAIGAPVLN